MKRVRILGIVAATAALTLSLTAAENPEFLKVKAVLAAKSDIPPVAKIAPYREALAVYEWAVQSGGSGSTVTSGKKLRVQHWVYYDNVKQSAADWPVGHATELRIERSEAHSEAQRFCVLDTLPLDVDMPVFFDVGQRLAMPTEAAIVARTAGLTEAMLVHRDKVRLIALGDSRTARGLDMEPFYGGAARDRPLAFNLAAAGSRVPSLEYKARQCAALLPALEWVVINVSPRIFAVGMSSASVSVLGGPPWPEKLGRPGKAAEIPETRILADLPSRTAPPLTAFDFSLPSWAIFEGMVRELDRLGVNTMLWTPPMRDRGTNDDFSSAGKYWGTLERLRGLSRTYSHCHLVDLMAEHRDKLVDADFADNDHLNRDTGGVKLAKLLDGLRQTLAGPAPVKRSAAMAAGPPAIAGKTAVAASVAALPAGLMANRDKVRLIALGDSRTARGLDVRRFFDGEAGSSAQAFNLAAAGSRAPALEYRARQCAAMLPALEWAVINASPRMFRVGVSTTNVTIPAGSPWPVKLGEVGSGAIPETRLVATLPSRTAPALTAADFSMESWSVFEGTIRELNRLGVKTLVWTPPMRDRSADDRFPSADTYPGFLDRLRGLSHTYNGCYVVDLMAEFRGRFVDADFADQDHLNATGAAKLGKALDEFREAPTWAHRLKISDTTPGRQWTALRHGTSLYLDYPGRSFDFVPRALLDLPFLQGKLGDRGHRGPVVFSFRVDRPVRVYVIGYEDSLKGYDWIMRDFKTTSFYMGYRVVRTGDDWVVRARDYPAGTITFGPDSGTVDLRMMYTVAVEPLD